jgi:hypothetical protein
VPLLHGRVGPVTQLDQYNATFPRRKDGSFDLVAFKNWPPLVWFKNNAANVGVHVGSCIMVHRTTSSIMVLRRARWHQGQQWAYIAGQSMPAAWHTCHPGDSDTTSMDS